MEDKIIIINGCGGCGKSTFIRFCQDYCNSRWQDVKVYELSSVDFVKDVAAFCGWDGTKTTKNRTFLHNIKVLLEEWNDVPNKKVLERINLLKNHQSLGVFFVNIREDYNINSFKAMAKKLGYNCLTLIVKNPNIITNEVPELISAINNYNYDVIINNNKNLSDLTFLANNFMQDLIDGKFDKE